MTITHKWYVVRVVSGQERKVKKTIDEFKGSKGLVDVVEEVLIPTENVAEVVQGQQKVTEKRLWPGYILVKMTLTDEARDYVRTTQGVLGFLGGENPAPLSEKEVENILYDLKEKKSEVVQKHKLEVGDHIKITDGVFQNSTGTVIEVFNDKGRVSVMVSIFGRDTRVDDLEFWQVKRITGDAEE